jgi:hypothetical protein
VACFKEYMDVLGTPDAISMRVERVVDAGDRQVPIVRVSGLASTSGVPHEHLWGYVVKVRDGRIAYFRAYYEPAEALDAVGLGDHGPPGTGAAPRGYTLSMERKDEVTRDDEDGEGQADFGDTAPDDTVAERQQQDPDKVERPEDEGGDGDD